VQTTDPGPVTQLNPAPPPGGRRFAKHYGKSLHKLGPGAAQLSSLPAARAETGCRCRRQPRGTTALLLRPHVEAAGVFATTVLRLDEVTRLIDAGSNISRRAPLTTTYETGMRRSEVVRLRVSDIDSQRMTFRVMLAKGGKDRDLRLSPELLETLRAYWR
jgi:integrase